MIGRMGGLLALAATWLASSSAEARCSEPFPIVGYGCRAFGTWNADDPDVRLSMRMTVGLHFSPLAGLSVAGTVSKTQSVSLPASLFDGLHSTSLSFGPTITGFIAGPVYLGAGVHLGPSFLEGSPRPIDGSVITASTGFFVQGGGILGLMVPSEWLHPFSFRGEVLIGGRLASFSAQVPPSVLPEGGSTSISATASTGLIEARLWADLWKNPWMTLSVAGGKNLLREEDYMIAFAIAGHLVPFDFSSSWW